MNIGEGQVLTLAERLYVDAVGTLVAAEQAEAEAFLVRKHETKPPRSDWEARAMAALDTNSATTLARGALAIAENRMNRESDAMPLNWEDSDADESD
jgi:hypothetical protein